MFAISTANSIAELKDGNIRDAAAGTVCINSHESKAEKETVFGN